MMKFFNESEFIFGTELNGLKYYTPVVSFVHN